jgi:hypothetical protein
VFARARACAGLVASDRLVPMTRIASLFAVALLSLSVVPGCGSPPAEVPDAAVDDAGGIEMDAGPIDAAIPIVCVGAPAPCATLATDTDCRTEIGCAWSQCAGFAVACDHNPTEVTCMADIGCVWSGTECSGVARDCGTFPESGSCGDQPGCTWSTRAQCRGTAVLCATFSAAVCESQPGCLVDRPDAGPVDSGPPDANCMSGATGSTTLAIHTVTAAMAGGTMDLADVAVRAEGPCAGSAIEMSTDASGVLSLDLPNAGAPWSITFARAGYSAISIIDVTNIGFDGDVRLDPLEPASFSGYDASGVVTGSIGIGGSVQVDTYDFVTTNAGAGGTWSSMYYLAPAPAPAPPLVFVALELDGTGRAVNFVASTEQPRTGAAATGIAMVLPTPAATAIETRITYHLPTSGIADASGTLLPFGVEHALLDASQSPYVLVGSETIETGPGAGDATLVVRHFGGPLDANFTGFQIQGTTGVINVLVTDITDHEVSVPPITALGVAGTTLGALDATGVGDGYDVLAVHIGESESDDPRWRVFADASGGSGAITTVPQLPSSVSLADIGLPDTVTFVIPLYIRMQNGRAWSTQGLNNAAPEYAYAGGANYTMVEL